MLQEQLTTERGFPTQHAGSAALIDTDGASATDGLSSKRRTTYDYMMSILLRLMFYRLNGDRTLLTSSLWPCSGWNTNT